MQLHFGFLAENLYDDMDCDFFCYLFYGICMLVRKREGYHCNIHIKSDYGCFTCTGISSKYHPGVLYVSLFGSAYLDHRCNTFEKKTERICYGNRIILCDSICVSADYAILGIKTNSIKVSALRESSMEKIIKEVGR